MAASMQMLSVKLFLVTHCLSRTLYAPRRFPIPVFRIGPQVDALRRSSGGLPRQTAHIRWYCLATNGAYEAPVESNELEDDCDDNESTGEEDFRKFQQIDKSRSRVKDGASNVPQNYLELTDKELFAQCKMDTYRASGPGGQHRNKTDSAVRLKHIPTGLVTQASEDRSQHNNRAYALGRLRQLIATEVRGSVELEGYKPPLEVVRILPFEKGARKDRLVQKIGPNHPDFAQGVKGLLDLLEAVGGSVSDAAAALGLTTGALSKLITSDRVLWQGANKIRASKGLKPLR
ncbi:hypothetical protein MPTK1_3g23210 [Marchantia polymorpha subsp. ruderalis]|uniref:Prokaryotic-type class I peptide chain release factors domain-containing protein n=2 Tax=Marchantia polymorpha TaxID=3197 RepID=A0AAF6B3W0_MARPO|nr:hypothetical protein MARPO_0024s0098 [Marchantia polymorpha]BBN06693.1 hypothetical protein Mp_3g23210 [Marchantia polymorpha subsp. ruderalis]PTQ43594.1 hypothetical protein MARPO_0024s0098 [Marchantia polymorpha]PTQ43595.1 hypothetical protein MARPO_0024s0098 [Marchantia polymorpha]BBN06694.1 hypothetical protein Mp_3g23210 [Marchantia polymorpha subsp. ruderalis]|eukprot:PTQ43593.1 hypothetical protein MARPO_0024s0098 [Marchantia polymorpha]